ncbi:MAG: hypothetical protein JXM69_19295 [Anaerolineae bacterium]|nr:hypothetical protein [Anaerolineae bacterium]
MEAKEAQRLKRLKRLKRREESPEILLARPHFRDFSLPLVAQNDMFAQVLTSENGSEATEREVSRPMTSYQQTTMSQYEFIYGRKLERKERQQV